MTSYSYDPVTWGRIPHWDHWGARTIPPSVAGQTLGIQVLEGSTLEGAAVEDPYRIGISGEFQGFWFAVDDIDIIGGESPVGRVVRAVLGLHEDEELLSVSVRRADGTVDVRRWDGE
jgi:hypothetical protein